MTKEITRQEQIEKLVKRQSDLIKLKNSYKLKRCLKQIEIESLNKKQGKNL